jgi:quercetin dioxygenase-like cupin family protein
VSRAFPIHEHEQTTPDTPEALVRFASAPVYELAPRAHFRDLFARRFGARGICGGFGVFQPGASLPCHFHDFDESITIVSGHAICQVAGREYALADCATACIPRGRPHRFLNRSDQPMAMIWVYAGDEPERTLVETDRCERISDQAELARASDVLESASGAK